MQYRFNTNVDSLAPSASVVLMEKAKAMKAQGIDVIGLAGGEPDCDTPSAAAYAGIQGICKGHTHYTVGRGILPLRNRLVKKLREENNIDCTIENILVTPGGKFSIYLTLRTLLNVGDEALILDPSWVSYAPIVVASGATPVHVEMSFAENYAITREALEKSVSPKSRVLIVNSPNNPTGRVMTEQEAQTICAFVKEHDLLVVSDEIYEKIIFDGRKHISLAALPGMAERVITSNGFSKFAAMTGWRLGYLVADKAIINKINMLYQHTMTCVSEFSQEAAVAALDLNEEVEVMRSRYEQRRDLFIGALQRIPGVTCLMPEGAFYAWVKIDYKGMSGPEICDYLLEEAKVAAVPGDAYGKGGSCCIRMSFATATEDLIEAARRITQALTR